MSREDEDGRRQAQEANAILAAAIILVPEIGIGLVRLRWNRPSPFPPQKSAAEAANLLLYILVHRDYHIQIYNLFGKYFISL